MMDMFLDKKDDGQLHTGSVLVGYDLGEEYSQISYNIVGQEEVETVATVMGTKQYNIPTLLCKKTGINQWLYGKDAVKAAGEEDMTAVDGLLALARKGEEIEVDGESFDPTALLTLFLKKSLTLLNPITTPDHIGAIVFTVAELDERMVEVLAKAVVNLGLKTDRIYFQSHTESLYYYILYQPKELWTYQVLAFEHDGRRLRTYRLECNRRTTPVVVLIEEAFYDTLPIPDAEEEETLREDACRRADERFLEIIEKLCEDRMISLVYLLGDGFRTDWHKRSLQFLCHNRRVFQGNNLFSRGACFGLRDRLMPGELSEKYVFLGKDKLKSNIGMLVSRQGKESYLALLDAGENWYEVRKEYDFYIEGRREIPLVVTPLNGRLKETKLLAFGKEGGSNAPFTKYHMEIWMLSAGTVRARLTDLGFGELFPGTGMTWEETIEVP